MNHLHFSTQFGPRARPRVVPLSLSASSVTRERKGEEKNVHMKSGGDKRAIQRVFDRGNVLQCI